MGKPAKWLPVTKRGRSIHTTTSNRAEYGCLEGEFRFLLQSPEVSLTVLCVCCVGVLRETDEVPALPIRGTKWPYVFMWLSRSLWSILQPFTQSHFLPEQKRTEHKEGAYGVHKGKSPKFQSRDYDDLQYNIHSQVLDFVIDCGQNRNITVHVSTH